MAQIKCNFCPKTIEAPLWPDETVARWKHTALGFIREHEYCGELDTGSG
jgi:hypothetical protein